MPTATQWDGLKEGTGNEEMKMRKWGNGEMRK